MSLALLEYEYIVVWINEDLKINKIMLNLIIYR